MVDVLKGLAEDPKSFFIAWVFPAAIAVALFSFLIVPTIETLAIVQELIDLSAIERTALLAFWAVALATILNALSTPLYRVLEGYWLPTSWQEKWKKSELNRKAEIKGRAEAASGIKQALEYEKLQRFPVDESQTAPTRLGNALRAFETYGWDHFRLDSQLFWSELLAVTPDALQAEVDQARAKVDFFVSFFYLSAILGISALLSLFEAAFPSWRLLLVAGVAFLSLPLWYWMASTSCSHWDGANKAMVNLGRKPLAESLGLKLPASLRDERRMWELLATLVFYPYSDPWADEGELDKFRSVESTGNEREVESTKSEPE